MKEKTLEEIARNRKIKVYDPFADFLMAAPEMHTFEISLLDCYHLAGHSCPSMTGAFLLVEKAVKELYANNVCLRGDIIVQMGAGEEMGATGPKANVISYITGAWDRKGFPGFRGGNYKRKNLISFNQEDLDPNEVRFKSISENKEVILDYNPSEIVSRHPHNLDFPLSWREDVKNIILESDDAIFVVTE